jgi:hypothetical protein
VKYEKPIIVQLAPATNAIQNSQKGSSETYDLMKETTVGAYEADE